MPITTSRLSVARRWLSQGVALVPLQPVSKHIVTGFGPYLKTITTEDDARFWFDNRRCNLAVVTGAGLVVLDFDEQEHYQTVCEVWPVLATTYTERTRRGWHVFLAGDSATGKRPGFEIKGRDAVVMSAPSIHPAGIQYAPVNPDATIKPAPAGFPLLDVTPTPMPVEPLPLVGDDLLPRIKRAVPILDAARKLTPLKSKDGRWWHGLCPFHGETRPSFWVDAQRGTFGCFACDAHGDVVNLYALSNNCSVKTAISELLRGA